MRKFSGVSALAVGVALIVAPASAASLNLGGDGALIDLGSSGSTLDVNVGTDIGVNVDPGGTPDITVDLDDGTDGSVTIDLGGSSGDVLDLDGGDIGVDLDGGSDDEVTLGVPGGDSLYVDLFGKGTGKKTRLVDLGHDNVNGVVDLDGGDAILDLFGDGTQPAEAAVDIDLIDDGLGAGDLGLDLNGLLGGAFIPGLFGEGGSVEVVDLGSSALPSLDLGDGTIPPIGLPPIAPTPGSNGDDGGTGDVAGTTVTIVNQPPFPDDVRTGMTLSGTDGRDAGISGAATTNRATARTRVANAKCFTPDEGQIAHLVASRTYSDRVVAAWRNGPAVQIVPVQLCPEARVKVSEVTYADSNMAIMRSGIAASPAIRQKLNGSGLDAEDVLAVDTKDGGVTVYVY